MPVRARQRVGLSRAATPTRLPSSSRSLPRTTIGHGSPSLVAHTLLQQARLDALRSAPEPDFGAAVAALRDVGEPFWVATALLEQAEWLAAGGRGEEALHCYPRRARCSSDLRAQPRLERLDALAAMIATTAPTSA